MALFDPTKAWWASKTIWGAVFVLIGATVDSFGPEEQAQALEHMIRLFEWGGAALALIGRITATKEIRL